MCFSAPIHPLVHVNSNVLFAADPPVGSGVPKHAALACVPSQAEVPVLTLAIEAAKNMYIKMHPRVDWRLSKNNSGRYPQSRQNGTCDQSGDRIAMLLQAQVLNALMEDKGAARAPRYAALAPRCAARAPRCTARAPR